MNIGQLNLPARYAAKDHFKIAYAQTQRAAELLIQGAGEKFPDDLDAAKVNELMRLLTEASCATRALKSILDGNPLPRRGD